MSPETIGNISFGFKQQCNLWFCFTRLAKGQMEHKWQKREQKPSFGRAHFLLEILGSSTSLYPGNISSHVLYYITCKEADYIFKSPCMLRSSWNQNPETLGLQGIIMAAFEKLFTLYFQSFKGQNYPAWLFAILSLQTTLISFLLFPIILMGSMLAKDQSSYFTMSFS